MSDKDQHTPQDAFELEISDLDPPGYTRKTLFSWVGQLLVRWQQPEHRRARRWLSNGLLTCLALVLLASLLNPALGFTDLVAAHWPFSPPQAPITFSSLSVAQLPTSIVREIQCPVASAWSPDSSQVALLGYTQVCNQNMYIPAQIDLYSAATAHEVARWSPDKAIIQAMQRFPGVSASMENELARKPDWAENHSAFPTIRYQRILWSSDRSHLALSFVAANYVFTYAGLLLATVDGRNTHVLLQRERSDFSPTTSLPLLWDLQQGSVTTLTLPPALAYSWDMLDRLVPVTPLDAQSNISTYGNIAPGTPDGGGTFTTWQPGHITIPAFGVYLWSTAFAAWSPDARYFLANFSFSGLMEPPDQAFPQNQELRRLQIDGVPHIPAHDPALLIAAIGTRVLAWNPAGTLLATYEASGVVNLYDCQTGHLQRQLAAPGASLPASDAATLLNWSPDGRSLQLSVAGDGRMVLWDLASPL